MGLVIYFVVI